MKIFMMFTLTAISFNTFSAEKLNKRLDKFVGNYKLASGESCAKTLKATKDCSGILLKLDQKEFKSFCNVNKSNNGFEKTHSPAVSFYTYETNKVELNKSSDTITSTNSTYLLLGKVGTYIDILKLENSETISLTFKTVDTPSGDSEDTCTYIKE